MCESLSLCMCVCVCESLCVGVAHDDDDDDDPIAYLCSAVDVNGAAAADCELRCAALCWLPDFRVFVFAFESALRQ